jgi:hypothetical protein
MNQLIQLESTLIGSGEDVLRLETLNSANILVVSDTHGEADLLREIILEFGNSCDALVFCGDGVCDVISCIEQSYEDRVLQEALPPVIALTRGNGDGELYPVMHYGPEETPLPEQGRVLVSKRVLFRAAGRNILAVHGNLHNVDFGTDMLASSAYSMDADIVFYGHTHRASWEENKATLILNPGSCARPRGRLPSTFTIVSYPGTTERYQVSYYGIRPMLFGKFEFYPLALAASLPAEWQ